MLSSVTRTIREDGTPPLGPCGGTTIWYMEPRRHWCKMRDEDVSLHILAGNPTYDNWNAIESEDIFDDAWKKGTIVLKSGDGRNGRESWEKDAYYSVVLHSKCRWKK